MSNSSLGSSGEGSRPTTDGGVDNIGAAKSFTPGKPGGGDEGPMGREKMSDVKKDDASLAKDDSAPLGLTQPPDTTSNTHPTSHAPA